jgi:hypothetical protein
MSFGFIDLTELFRKIILDKSVRRSFEHLQRDARTDNIQSLMKKIEDFRFFLLDNLKP